MNDTLCRGAWDRGCTDIMYMIIEHPIYPIISLPNKGKLCENVVTEKFKFPLRDLNFLTTATQATTPLLLQLINRFAFGF